MNHETEKENFKTRYDGARNFPTNERVCQTGYSFTLVNLPQTPFPVNDATVFGCEKTCVNPV
jgi:hypothetical protein